MGKRLTRIWSLIGATLLLAGCPADVYYTQLLAPPHALAPRRIEDVEVQVVTPPTRPHVDIGLLQVTSGVDAQTSTEMVARLRAEAAARGCDAVLVTSIENQAARDTRRSVHGSCIVYEIAPPSAPAPTFPAPAPRPAVLGKP